MSEEKKQRTVREISVEYSRLATKAGDLQYKIWAFKRDLDMLAEQMQDLNFEATAAHAAETAAPLAAVEASAPAQESAPNA